MSPKFTLAFATFLGLLLAHLATAANHDDTIKDCLYFSQLAEGSSNNKWVQISNKCSVSFTLDKKTALVNYVNARSVGWEYVNYFPDGAVIEANGNYLWCHGSQTLVNKTLHCDHTHNFLSNGDDSYALAVALDGVSNLTKSNLSNIMIVDAAGPTEDHARPVGGFTVCNVTAATQDNVLVRKCSAASPIANWTVSVGTSEVDCAWIIMPQDTTCFVDYACGNSAVCPIPVPSPPPSLSPPPPYVAPPLGTWDPTKQDCLYFSAYADPDKSSFRARVLEIWNQCSSDIDLTYYAFASQSNGSPDGRLKNWNRFTEGAVIRANANYLICHPEKHLVNTNSSFAKAVMEHCDQENRFLSNGNDAFTISWAANITGPGLSPAVPDNYTVLDIIGYLGEDPGISFTACGDDKATLDSFMLRKLPAKPNMGNWDVSSGTNPEDCEWVIHHDEFHPMVETMLNSPGVVMPLTPAPAPAPAPMTFPPPLAVVDDAMPKKIAAVTMAVGGYTKTTFDDAAQTAFKNGIASTANVQATAVTITRVTDVARRHLLATSVSVDFEVEVADIAAGEATIASITAAVSDGSLATTLMSSGLTAVTTTVVSKSGVTEKVSPPPSPPPQIPVETSSSATCGASAFTLVVVAFSALLL